MPESIGTTTQTRPARAAGTFFGLTGKRCVVTGAGAGIGRAIAGRFAAAGAQVWLTDIDGEAIDRLRGELDEMGGQARSAQLDVGDASACRSFSEQLAAAWPGGADVLVNNAGIGLKGTLPETELSDFQSLQRVNVEGVFNLTKALLPPMIQRRSGSVINTASIGGVLGLSDRVAYCTTKFAVVGLTKSMALDHAKDNVRVNCICPGRVHTPFVDRIIQGYDDPDAAYAQMAGTQPLGRMARPEEIAAAAHYLASDDASFITGTAFTIDGGFSAGK